jgi:hypothetical protein
LDELDAIVEASFGGPESGKALGMIEEAGRLEHVTDIAQQRFVRRVLEPEDTMKPLDIVRHPRQSRWLDEWDRLKGGRFPLRASLP